MNRTEIHQAFVSTFYGCVEIKTASGEKSVIPGTNETLEGLFAYLADLLTETKGPQ